MRSKAPLALMEQAIMVLVFALAAALCLRAFIWSDNRSAWNEARDLAVLQAERVAEVLKHHRGDVRKAGDALGMDGLWDGAVWSVAYDENWQETQQDGEEFSYILQAEPVESEHPLLGRAQVTVTAADGGVLFSLPVSWQEVDSYDR